MQELLAVDCRCACQTSPYVNAAPLAGSTSSPTRVRCRLVEDAVVAVGVPQIAVEVSALQRSAASGQVPAPMVEFESCIHRVSGLKSQGGLGIIRIRTQDRPVRGSTCELVVGQAMQDTIANFLVSGAKGTLSRN